MTNIPPELQQAAWQHIQAQEAQRQDAALQYAELDPDNAIAHVTNAYVNGQIEVDELEQRLDEALHGHAWWMRRT